MPGNISAALAEKYRALIEILRSSAPGCLAVSGGLDSRLLSFLIVCDDHAAEFVHFTGPHVNPSQSAAALAWLESLSYPYAALAVDPLALPAVAMNAKDRCYHCKHVLFSALAGHAAGRTMMDGTNASDLGQYRPGLRALEELGVLSPFAMAGIGKQEIRDLAHHVGLPDPEQPSTPCLLTRFPYDAPVRPDALRRIGKLEDELAETGFRDFRVRADAAGNMVLYAHPRNEKLAGKTDLEIVWTQDVSGFYDVQ